MVSDILWLRSIIILSNLFGIAVNYSFKPPFMIGIRWNFFFILANLIQIARILNDRRDVELNEEEQQLYDALFGDTFSRQEYKKLLNEAEWHDLQPGQLLMAQGEQIDKIHLISKGVCVVEQDRLTPLTSEEVELRHKRGDLYPLQTKQVSGQTILITSGSPLPSVDSTSTIVDNPPSITRTIATSLLQGGISWFDRFRRVTRDEELVAATTKMGGRLENVGVIGNQIGIGIQQTDHTTGQMNQHQQIAQSEVTNSGAPTTQSQPTSTNQLTINTGSDMSIQPLSSTSSSSSSANSLPDVVILPTSPHSQAGLPSSSTHSSTSAHHAPDSHHLLNVHVDTKVEPTLTTTPPQSNETSESSAVSSLPSSTSKDKLDSTFSSLSSSSFDPREVLPTGSGFGDVFSDLLHADVDEDEDEETIQPEVKQSQLNEKRQEMEASAVAIAARSQSNDSADLSSIDSSSNSSSLPPPISNEDVLRSWREDRARRRSERLAELERKRADELAEKERKRLLSRSALERQFGAASQAASEAAAKQTDAPTQTQTTQSNGIIHSEPIPPSIPVFEKHTNVVGYIRDMRLIGEMSMVSPGGAGQSDYTVAPVSVTTKEPTRVLSWEKSALQRLFFRLPSLAVGWYAVVSTDLVNRLKQQRSLAHQNSYRALLMGVLADGSVSEHEKAVCAKYRDENDLSLEYHQHALASLGWSLEDWDRGSTQTGWLQNWFKKKP